MDRTYAWHGIAFEWDERKARANASKHSVTFEEAAQAFLDPFALHVDATVDLEPRDGVIGYSGAWRLLLVVYTVRVGHMRIISARVATRQERRSYEQA